VKALGLAATAVLTAAGSPANTLVFTRADGTRVPMPTKVSVFCGPWETAPGETPVRAPSLHVRALSVKRRVAWELTAVLRDVHAGSVVRLPHSPLYDRPTQAVLFVNDRSKKNEASTATETSRGTLRFGAIGCNPAQVDVVVDATVGSEFGDGAPIRARGRLRARR
jgi:hypothetical protein